MERRRFLVAVTGAAGLIAGCTGGSVESEPAVDATPEPTPTREATATATADPTGTPTERPTATKEPTPNANAADAIEDAQRSLNEAIDLIHEETGNAWSATGDASLSTAGIEAALENTHESLKTAEKHSGAAQQQWIDAIRTHTTYVEQVLGVAVHLGEGINELSTAVSYERSERYGDAVEKLQDATSVFEESRSELSAARGTLDDVDERLVGEINYAEEREAAGELAGLLEGYSRITAAGVHLVRGLESNSEAFTHYNNQNFDAAAFDFRAAARQFEVAGERYRRAEDEVVQSFRSAFITRACRAERSREGTSLLAKSSEAAHNERYADARRLRDEASVVLNRTCG